MNERIKQLSDIAYQNHLKNNPNSSFSPRADYVKEFAELIVRECVAKTMEVGEQNDEPIEPIWVANCIAHRIFKHFGV